MRYFAMFEGIGGFTKGIEQAYERTSIFNGRERKLCGSGRELLQRCRQQGQQMESDGNRKPICTGISEIDRYASAIYRYHYPGHANYGDAFKLSTGTIPGFDLLTGGFPCQAFSIAGKRKGFDDVRGTLFFEIARVLSDKRPRHFLLENVRGLISHERGKTFARILGVLSELGYFVETTVLNSKDYGVPQNRERVFFIGHSSNECAGEILSFGHGSQFIDEQNGQRHDVAHTVTNSDKHRGSYVVASSDTAYALDANYHKGCNDITKGRRTVNDSSAMEKVMVGTLRTHNDGKGFREIKGGNCPTIPARAREDGSGQPVIMIDELTGERNQRKRVYGENGLAPSLNASNATGGNNEPKTLQGSKIRRLTPTECARLQGFPDDWAKFGLFEGDKVKEISDTQQYKCFGNAVSVPAVEAIILKMLEKGCL